LKLQVKKLWQSGRACLPLNQIDVTMKKILLSAVFSFLLLGTALPVSAQCSMCKRVAESNMENGEVRGKGLNTGILYLMSVPYVMAGVVGYVWWKKRQTNKTTENPE